MLSSKISSPLSLIIISAKEWGELDQAKLPRLLELKYDTIRDAISELEGIEQIQNVFVGFQEHLYMPMMG